MNSVEDARKAWIERRPEFEEFARLIAERLRNGLRGYGFWYDVSARAKEVHSLVKKLLLKQEHTFASLPDKVGVRIITRYRQDLDAACDAARRVLRCPTLDDKEEALGIDKVGYRSRHMDFVTLSENDAAIGLFPASEFWAELQVRTLAQHLWSEMSHDTIYKNDETLSRLPLELKRRVNLMAGQIEVADREFDRLAKELPHGSDVDLLQTLQKHYLSLTAKQGDPELSLKIISIVIPTYHSSVPAITAQVDKFLEEKRKFLETIYSQAELTGASNVSPLLFQPEALLLYERLENDKLEVQKAWNTLFPERELDDLAMEFGMSLD